MCTGAVHAAGEPGGRKRRGRAAAQGSEQRRRRHCLSLGSMRPAARRCAATHQGSGCTLLESRQHGWQRGAAQPPTKGRGVPLAVGKLRLVSGAVELAEVPRPCVSSPGLLQAAETPGLLEVLSRALPELHGTGRCGVGDASSGREASSAGWTEIAWCTAGRAAPCLVRRRPNSWQGWRSRLGPGWPQNQRGGVGPGQPQVAEPACRVFGRAVQLVFACGRLRLRGFGSGSAAGCA